MKDCAANRFGDNKDFEVLPSKSDIGESSYRKHSLWMAHWTRASSSAEPQNGQSCSRLEEMDDVGYSKDCGALPFELMKARVAERLMVGVSNGGASAENTRQFSSNMWGVADDVCQEVQCKNIDQFDRSFDSSLMHQNVNLYAAKTVVSERFSVHKLLDLSVDSHKILSSDKLSPDWSHFPMFAINRKISSILNPRRSVFAMSSDKIFVPQKSLKANMSTSNVLAFSSKEYRFHTHQVTDENTSHCKSAGGILSHLDNHIGLNAEHSGKILKGHLSIEESCSCSKDEANSSCSIADERHGSHHFANSKETPRWSSENKFMSSAGRKENEIVGCSFLGQKFGASEGCQKQQDFKEVVFHEPALGREYEIKPVNACSVSKGNDVDIDDHGVIFANLLQGEQQHRVDAAIDLTESCKLPDTIEKTLTMKCKNEALACGKPPKRKLVDSIQKGPCLFEMPTLPSKSHVTCSKDPTCSGNSCGEMGNCLLGAQKPFSTKTDTLYSGTHHASKSTGGFASTSTQKDSGCPNSAKTERVVTSSTKGVSSCSGGNETFSLSAEHHNSHCQATCANKQDWSTPKMSSMNLDLVLFQISRMRNPISNGLTVPPECSDPSDKWLKRLQHDISDPHVPCSKRPKIGDGPLLGGTCTVFGRVLDYGTENTGMIKHVKEDKLMQVRFMDQQIQEGSPVSAQSLNSWIGRWCQGGTPIRHGTSHIEKQGPRSNLPPDALEGQFPSIAAMAMMGRVMNKLRPCEFEKRGPSVVWKTEGL